MAANWKMNKTHLEGLHFVESLRNTVQAETFDKIDVVLCPPFTAIRSVQTAIDGDDLQIAVGAQNIHWESSGAYTGEISAEMLTKLGVTYVIIGHSERREYFHETDETVNRKVKAAFDNGLVPIMCVGETLSEREAGSTAEKVSGQIREGLKGVKEEQIATMVIAYEPIWAIGTGKTASADDAQDTVSIMRKVVREKSENAASAVRIQYGGSVKVGNVADLMSRPDIDGALVGGASLDPTEFAQLLQY